MRPSKKRTFRNGVRWSFVEKDHLDALGHGIDGAGHRDIFPWFLDDSDRPLQPDAEISLGQHRAAMYVLATDHPWNAYLRPGLKFVLCSGPVEIADGVITSETRGLTTNGEDYPERPQLLG